MKINIKQQCLLWLLIPVLLGWVAAPLALADVATLVPPGSVWKYLDDGTDPGPTWPLRSFDDNDWASDLAQLGYGDGDEVTVVNFGPDPSNRHITTYFRHTFAVDNVSSISNLTLRLLRDDGAVVYLNGREVFRSNMPGGEVRFDTLANSTVEEPEENEFISASVEAALLETGTNVLAAEVHQASVSSSDMSFDLELLAGGGPGPDSPPVIISGPDNQSARAGSTVVFSVMASGTPPLVYQWFFGGNPIAGATSATLLLGNLVVDQSGIYSVEVSNGAGTVTASAVLTVVPPPEPHPGGLDWSFQASLVGSGGVLAAALDAQGRIVIGGYFTNVSGIPRNRLARVLPDGSVDPAFVPHAGIQDPVRTLAVQPDGKVVIACDTVVSGHSTNYGIARLNPDGSVDATFNPGLRALSYLQALAIQPDGRILIGGWLVLPDGSAQHRVARLRNDGTLEESFQVRLDNGPSSLVGQADGKILVGGRFTTVNNLPRYGLARLHADGTVDATFDPGYHLGYTVRLAVQPDGRILVGSGLCLVRLNTDGTLDPSFDTSATTRCEVLDLALQPDGKIVVGGCGECINHLAPGGIIRLNPDGSRDESFDPGSGVEGEDAEVKTIVLQPDGKIILGGEFTSFNGVPANGIARLLGVGSEPPVVTAPPVNQTRLAGQTATFSVEVTGTPPLSYQWLFAGSPIPGATSATLVLENLAPDQSGVYSVEARNPGGMVVTSALLMVSGQVRQEWVRTWNSQDTMWDTVTASALDAQGNVYLTGRAHRDTHHSDNDMVTMSYDSAGSLRWIASHTNSGPSRSIFPVAMAVDGHGNAHVLASAGRPLRAYVTLKYGATGALVWEAVHASAANHCEPVAIAVAPNGNVMVTGGAPGAGSDLDFTTVNYDPDGHELWVAQYAGAAGASEWATALTVDPEGNIYVTGGERLDQSGRKQYTTLKYSPAGQQLWVATLPESAGGQTSPRSMAVDAQGNVYVTGRMGAYGAIDYGTVKYDSSGQQLWLARYGAPQFNRCEATDLKLDSAGNVHVTGASDAGLTTVKYDTQGRLLWAAHFNDNDRAGGGVALDLDAAGNVYVTGRIISQVPGRCSRGMVTVKYDDQGREQWRAELAGEHPVECYPGRPTDIHVTESGNVYVTGSIQENLLDYVAVKYTPLNWPGAPGITAAPQPVAMAPGLTATFTVAATGAEPLHYQWLFNGRIIPGANHASLELPNVSTNDQGTFSVAVWNDEGGLLSSEARLQVAWPPIIVAEPSDQVVSEGQRATFAVTVIGTPPLFYQWRFEDDQIPGATNSTLTLDSVQFAHAGRYTVIVTNIVGTAFSRSALLTVLPPGHPVTTPGEQDMSFQAGLVGNGGVVAAALDAQGRIVIGGYFTNVNGIPRDYLARLLPDGSVDPAFVPDAGIQKQVRALAFQSDGKVVISCDTVVVGNSTNYGVARLNPDGSVDPTFHPGLSGPSNVDALAVQPDGRILIGGSLRLPDGSAQHRVARLLEDGTVEASFQVQLDNGPYCLVVQADGKILVGGLFTTVNNLPWRSLVRLHADGTVDASFEPGSNIKNTVHCLAVQPDGRILAGGWFTLVRLNADGTSDRNFNKEGSGHVFSLALQPDGKIVVGGCGFDCSNTLAPGGIIRLNSDGSRDESFDPGTGIEGADAEVRTIVLQSDGKIIIGGEFTSFNGLPANGLARLYGRPIPASFFRREIAGLTVRVVATPHDTASVYAVEDQPPDGWLIANISHEGVFDAVTGKVKFGPFYDHEPRILAYEVLPPAGTQGVFTFTGQASADGTTSPIAGDQYLHMPGFHPADSSPSDWNLLIGEITAYGAAWRRGQEWPEPPNPIPIEYVTRAAALWRQGECYEVNWEHAPPLCWVNCARPAGMLAGQTGLSPVPDVSATSGITRQASLIYIPGEPLTITLTVAPAGNTLAYALEERLPAGCTAVAISSGGEFDAASGVVRWGPFLDSQVRTLNYQLLPLDLGGPLLLSGVGSFDGVNQAIAGPQTLLAGCRLLATQQPDGSGFRLELTGTPGAYCIEASTNLSDWERIGGVTLSAGVVEFTDPERGQHRFYRLRMEGP